LHKTEEPLIFWDIGLYNFSPDKSQEKNIAHFLTFTEAAHSDPTLPPASLFQGCFPSRRLASWQREKQKNLAILARLNNDSASLAEPYFFMAK